MVNHMFKGFQQVELRLDNRKDVIQKPLEKDNGVIKSTKWLIKKIIQV